MQKVLIAGGAGFIGSNLCRYLLKSGKQIICVDNCISGSVSNIDELMHNQSFSFIEQSITEKLLESLTGIDTIYNLACPASPVFYSNYSLETLDVCFNGLKNLLECARKWNAVLVQSSTSEIYGNALLHPQKESYYGNVNPFGPRSCYDEGKRVGEALCYEYIRKYGVDVKIVRIFNTYGPYMRTDDGRVISTFVTQALQKGTITIHGDGLQTRSFCYIDDLIRGLLKVAETEIEGPVNLGNPEERTILSIVECLEEILQKKLKIINLPKLADDPYKRKPDITKAKDILNWHPRINFMCGLHKTVDWFKNL